MQRPLFQDRGVRRALNYFLDFEWMNKNLFYGQYTRVRSYFQNTGFAARGLPSPEELAILEPIRSMVPPEVFTEEYNPPVTDGTGLIRPQAREAVRLLHEAGWDLKAGKLINANTGEQMSFELLIYNASDERVAIPLRRNLARYGIDMRIRIVDVSQYVNRRNSYDFDMVSHRFPAIGYPSADLAIMWHSAYIDSTWNTPGVSDPAVDYIIEEIIASQEDERKLLILGSALDRVLTWNFYGIPQWYMSAFRLAYKDKFGKPALRPTYDIGLETWWAQ
jgi:microcin C transport system substrate-binding protein